MGYGEKAPLVLRPVPDGPRVPLCPADWVGIELWPTGPGQVNALKAANLVNADSVLPSYRGAL